MIKIIQKIYNHEYAGIAAIAIGAATTGLFIYFGFDYKLDRILSCHASVTKYVTAEYSETTLGFEGQLETDYWSDPASEVYRVSFSNGGAPTTSHDMELTGTGNLYYPPMPAPYKDYSRVGFDGFQQHTKTSLEVYIQGSSFSEPLSKYPECVDKIDRFARIDTWYGFSYASNF